MAQPIASITDITTNRVNSQTGLAAAAGEMLYPTCAGRWPVDHRQKCCRRPSVGQCLHVGEFLNPDVSGTAGAFVIGGHKRKHPEEFNFVVKFVAS